MCRFSSFGGEPDLAEVLTDPIVQALMRADGCDMRGFYDSLEALTEADRPVRDCGRQTCVPQG